MSSLIYPPVRGLGFTVVKSIDDSVIIQESPGFVSTRLLQNSNPRRHWQLIYDWLTDDATRPNAALAYTDLQYLMGFIQARGNSYDDFLYLDPDENFVGPGVITATWLPGYPYALGAIAIAGGNAWQVISAPAGARSGYTNPLTGGGPVNDGSGPIVWTNLGAASGAGWPNPQATLQVITDGTNYWSPIQHNLGGQFYEDVFDFASAITVYDNGTATTNFVLVGGGLSIPGFSSSGLFLAWHSAPTGPVTATFNYYYRVRFEDDATDFEKFANKFWTLGGSEGSKGKGQLKLVSSFPFGSSTQVPATPLPPLNFPAGSTQVAMLYPTKVQLINQGGIASGAAGASAYGRLLVSAVTFGFTPPTAIFSGYSLPSYIAPAAVKAVYTYLSSSCSPAIGQGADPLFDMSTTVTGGSGSLYGRSFGGNGSLISVAPISGGGNPAANNYPFSTVQQTGFTPASVNTSFVPPDVYYFSPRLLVYY